MSESKDTRTRAHAVKSALGSFTGTLIVVAIYTLGYWNGVDRGTNLALPLLIAGAAWALVFFVALLWRSAGRPASKTPSSGSSEALGEKP